MNLLRANTNFARKFNVDSIVQSSHEKYSTSVFRESVIVSCCPALTRRGGRVVTNVERGMRWTLWGRTTSDDNADGEGVWS